MTSDDSLNIPFTIEDQEILRQVCDKLPIAVLELDLVYNIVYANRAALAMLGRDYSVIEKGLNVRDLVPPEQVQLIEEGLARLAEGARPTFLSLRIIRSDGAQVPAQVFTHNIESESGLSGFVVHAVDVTRQARVEEKLREQGEAFRLIVEHSQLGILVVDGQYKIVYVNDGLCTILGVTRGDLLGHDFREHLHPDSVEMVADYYVRRRRGEDVPSIYEFKMRHSDGRTIDSMMNVTTMVNGGGKTLTVAQIQDVTESQRSKEMLEDSELRYRTLVETMEDGLGIDDENGNLSYVNPAFVRMLGYDSAEELLGRPITDIMFTINGSPIESRIEKRKRGEVESYEAQMIHTDGHLIPVMVAASPLYHADGSYAGSCGILTDVSDLKYAETEARFLLDLLLHDIGNQLQLVVAGADLIHTESSMDTIENARQYVLDGAHRCLDLITKIRLLEEAKKEPLKPVNLVPVLHGEILVLQRQFGMLPILGELPESVIVMADSALSHMLWNLMENALKHNPEREKKIWISGHESEDKFILVISDNGPGLHGLKKSDLFNPMRRFGGVGLHIVNSIATKYGASIKIEDRVEGKPRKGLKFIVTFQKVE